MTGGARNLCVAITIASVASVLLASRGAGAEPRVLVEGYKLQQLAREPDIVTPIGVAFDHKGRLLVVESHTHQRPEEYSGPAGDRIRMFADSDGDGRLDRWTTFAEGYRHAMNVCVRPDGGVYVVARGEVHLLRDADGDGVAEDDQTLLRLETEDDYPHDALSGIVYQQGSRAEDDRIYLGLGENHGMNYKLVAASDSSSYEDHGGAGMVFRCRPDGSELERYATGFWNPFSLCLAHGRLFLVDNDPDASPPCRLIDVQYAGDYGFRFEYGRAGTHPLLAWDGELPGTLPMICGTGEGPTAVVAHRGYLWVTSWGDYRIERYELVPNAEGRLTAKRTVVVQGDADFRPTGMAVGPDGALYFADWVDRSYPVHGKGRVWRLALPNQTGEAAGPSPAQDVVVDNSRDVSPLAKLIQLHWQGMADPAPTLRAMLRDADADVRLYAIRWIAEERIAALRDDVAKLLDGEIPNERYFLAVLAAIDWLDGKPEMRDRGISDELVIRELENSDRSPKLKTLALRLLSPNHKWLNPDRLRTLVKSEDQELALEAVRTLAQRTKSDRLPLLAEIAADGSLPSKLRVEAVVGLAAAAESHQDLLARLAMDDNKLLADEATRVLRLTGHLPQTQEQANASPPPADRLEEWTKLIAAGGDAKLGRRLFFTPAGPRCAACHAYEGRGGRVGPDLSLVGRQQSRERIIASILQPSREIAPHYQAWTLLTLAGKTHAGLKLPEGGDDGEELYADATGKRFKLKSEDIELRQPNDKSIMPDGLERTLTVEDLRDLVAFLSANE